MFHVTTAQQNHPIISDRGTEAEEATLRLKPLYAHTGLSGRNWTRLKLGDVILHPLDRQLARPRHSSCYPQTSVESALRRDL
jgi:hypothetical protein